MLSNLQHPNIVRFYGLEEGDAMAFMMMDYVEGRTLKRVIYDYKGQMPQDELRTSIRSVCSALHFAHSKGLIHCDLKPANIMINESGRTLLADFGIARMTDNATTTLVGAGTPAYMAPEQARGFDPTPQTDIYQLGIVLYEMLTGGDRPFIGALATTTGSTAEKVLWEQIHADPPAPSEFNRAITPEMVAIVLRCLNKEPEERYRNTIEVTNAIDEVEAYTRDSMPFAAVERPPLDEDESPDTYAISFESEPELEADAELLVEQEEEAPVEEDWMTVPLNKAAEIIEPETPAHQSETIEQEKPADQPDIFQPVMPEHEALAEAPAEEDWETMPLDKAAVSIEPDTQGQQADASQPVMPAHQPQTVRHPAAVRPVEVPLEEKRSGIPVWRGAVILALGWLISWGLEDRVITVVVSNWILTKPIVGLIGGTLTAGGFRLTKTRLAWWEMLVMIVGWMLAWLAGGYTGAVISNAGIDDPLAGVIIGVVIGAIGGATTSLMLKRAGRLGLGNLVLIAAGWVLGWVISWLVYLLIRTGGGSTLYTTPGVLGGIYAGLIGGRDSVLAACTGRVNARSICWQTGRNVGLVGSDRHRAGLDSGMGSGGNVRIAVVWLDCGDSAGRDNRRGSDRLKSEDFTGEDWLATGINRKRRLAGWLDSGRDYSAGDANNR